MALIRRMSSAACNGCNAIIVHPIYTHNTRVVTKFKVIEKFKNAKQRALTPWETFERVCVVGGAITFFQTEFNWFGKKRKEDAKKAAKKLKQRRLEEVQLTLFKSLMARQDSLEKKNQESFNEILKRQDEGLKLIQESKKPPEETETETLMPKAKASGWWWFWWG